ncbi:putative NADP-dependent alcohol dehydrogenase C 2 [Thozetella sp. PMI_491]|nr:putative NADP-dependent alcohol dehydrogenase C 2 [Thozetella sp. PMI_491]
MATENKFHGWLGESPESAHGKMVWKEFTPKTWTEDDVDIKITHCGICGSDIHTLRSGWGPTTYPCCVGHEIVGTVARVGKNVASAKGFRVGDRVGLGAQAWSCGNCPDCTNGLESYCRKFIGTYNGKFADGSRSMGGYADYVRAPGRFVVRIPDALASADAAPMLCGGVTVYSPLKLNGCGPGKAVGIVGIGGLGHFGLLFAKSLGASKVVAISRTGSKKQDALRMGADYFIATDEDKSWTRTHGRSLDLIVSTVSSPDLPLGDYLRLLKTRGIFIQVGAPEDKIPAINAMQLIGKGVMIGGSNIGSPADIEEMLAHAAAKKVKPWVQVRSMKSANAAIVEMEAGKARYRYVLTNDEDAKL